jgi:hypothetical protein
VRSSGTCHRFKFHLAGYKLIAARMYFDNAIVMQQISGNQDASAVPDFAPILQTGCRVSAALSRLLS